MSRLYILCGPTAVGKTDLAIALSQKLPLEIVNTDALQCFKEMDIGTAKPTPEELQKVKHHMVDIWSPSETLTVARYAKEANECIADIFSRGRIPLVVGGAGFYIRALLSPPLDFPQVALPPGISHEQQLALIQEKDPDLLKKVHPNDAYRIERAARVILAGKFPSQLWQKTENQTCPYQVTWLGLSMERDTLYARINLRMQQMFEKGLIEETDALAQKYPSCIPRLETTIGYQQAWEFLKEVLTREQALEIAQQKTRNYAKRQITWFKKNKEINWIDCSKLDLEIPRVLEFFAC